MPQNRYQRTREDKSEELTAIAARLFLEKGYDKTTIAEIAREAGIATNVVHWYFTNKDMLFVASLESLLSQNRKKLESQFDQEASGSKLEPLVAFLTESVCRRLNQYKLITTVHDRSHHSPVISAFHDEAHRQYRMSLEHVLCSFNLRHDEQNLVIEAFTMAMEGLIMHQSTRSDTEQMMRFLAERFIGNRSS